MAGSLVLVDTFTVSSSVASVIIGGGSNGSSSYNYAMDDTYDVYKLVITNLRPSADDAPMMRVTKSGSADATSNYDRAHRYLKADTTHTHAGSVNAQKFDCMTTIDTASTASGNGIFYFFNFANSSEYSFGSYSEAHIQAAENTVRGVHGGFTHTVASASDGIFVAFDNYASGSTIEEGKFSLYGLKK